MNKELKKKCIEAINELLDIIEEHAPDEYYESDSVFNADDVLKELEEDEKI